MTLRRRLLAGIFGLSVPSVALAGAMAIYGSYRMALRQMERELGKDLTTLSDDIRADLERWDFVAKEVAAEIRALRSTFPQGQVPPKTWEKRLGTAFRTDPALSGIVLRERGGATALVLHRMAQGILRGRRVPWSSVDSIRRGLLEGAEAGPVTLFRPKGALIYTLSPLEDPDRSPPHDLLLQEHSATLLCERIFEGSVFHSFEACSVAARSGDRGDWRCVFSSDPTRIGLPLDDAPRGTTGRPWSFDVSGGRIRGTGIRAPTGWAIRASFSLAPALQSLRAFCGTAGLLLGLMALLVIAGVLHVTRGFGSAVEKIEAATAALARGELREPIHLGRRDELGRIARRIDRVGRDLMESAEARALARLSSRLMHDLKGILSQMNLLLYNLRENSEDVEFRAESLDLLGGLVRNVEGIVGKLRRAGREGEVALEPLDLDSLVRSVLERPDLLAREGLEIELDLRATRPAVTSRELLIDAIDNIVGHTVEAMRGGGHLRVFTGEIPPGPHGEGPAGPTHFVEIAAASHGRLEARRHPSGRGKGGGTVTPLAGVGGFALDMYTVRRTLGRIGGTLELESWRDGEARFRIEVGRRRQ